VRAQVRNVRESLLFVEGGSGLASPGFRAFSLVLACYLPRCGTRLTDCFLPCWVWWLGLGLSFRPEWDVFHTGLASLVRPTSLLVSRCVGHALCTRRSSASDLAFTTIRLMLWPGVWQGNGDPWKNRGWLRLMLLV